MDASVPLEMPSGIPGARAVEAQAAAENFPVALRILPRAIRRDLMAVYRFARLVDDIGDEYQGDRLAALGWVEHDLDEAAAGRARHPVLAALTPTIRSRQLDLAPFRHLIDANRRDQTQHRYQTFTELLDYCRLSANPVGRLVLAVFEVSDPNRAQLSDDVCSGLQVVEHLQDVAEDLRSNRVYLPLDDLARFGCAVDDLRQPTATPNVRELIAFECGRARELLASGRRLAADLPLRPRLAVSGFVGGGLAALDAIAAADHDVLSRRCSPRGDRVVLHAARTATSRRTAEPVPVASERSR